MARINLLPWRAELRERKNKEFLTIIAMVTLLAAVIAFAVWFFFNTEYKEQIKANKLITEENAKLDIALKEIDELEQRREEMISRMKVIQDLQGKRPLPVMVFDEITRAVPDALFLKEISRKDDTITIKGKADNPNVVSSFITNLDNAKSMGGSNVSSIDDEEKQSKKVMSRIANSFDKNLDLRIEDTYIDFEITTQIKSNISINDIEEKTDKEVQDSDISDENTSTSESDENDQASSDDTLNNSDESDKKKETEQLASSDDGTSVTQLDEQSTESESESEEEAVADEDISADEDVSVDDEESTDSTNESGGQ